MKTLLVALLLFVVGTGTAFAECAWVLWGQYTTWPGGQTPSRIEWDRLAAVDTYDRCLTMMEGEAQPRTGPGTKEVKAYGPDALHRRSRHTTFKDGDVTRVEYSCWPDTIADPWKVPH